MTKLKDSSYDAGFDAGVRAFMYTVATKHLNWNLSFFGEKLSALVDEWCDQWRAFLPQSDKPPFPPSDELPRPLSSEFLVTPPPLEVFPEQVIESDPVVNIEENDENEDALGRMMILGEFWTTRMVEVLCFS